MLIAAQRCVTKSQTDEGGHRGDCRPSDRDGPTDGKLVTLQTLGVRFMIPGDDTDGRFSLVEHPIPPLSLAAPLHRHSHEDEYSYVLEGRMGALLGDEVVYAEVGDLVYKPRGQWHTFWNAIDGPTRILEIISPPASSSSSRSSPTSSSTAFQDGPGSARCASATASTCSSTASRASSSASGCAFPARSERGRRRTPRSRLA